jgi:glycerol transport system ATP-binding protein
LMNDGRSVQIGTPDDLFERPEHTFVGYFIGSPGMNLMAAKVSGSRALVEGAELQLSAIYPDPPKGDLGRKRLAYVTLGGQQIVATIPPEMSSIGDQAKVVFDPTRTHVYVDDIRVTGAAA